MKIFNTLSRRNLLAKSEMPYERPVETLGTHVVLDSGDYAGLLDKALAGIGWDALQAELRRRRAAGSQRRRRRVASHDRRGSLDRQGLALAASAGRPRGQ